MKHPFLSLFLFLFLLSCAEKKEEKESVNETIPATELSKSDIEKNPTAIDTSLLFKGWATDRSAPHVDFLLTKDEYITTERSLPYTLNGNHIEIESDGFRTKGIINHLSNDTLKITWANDRLETIYLSYKNGYSFSREDILKTMKFYGENYAKEATGHDFVDNELDPRLYALGEMVCDTKDEELFASFLEMMLASQGSASETPSDVFSTIYFCHPELVLDYLKNKYTDDHLKGQLEFGFMDDTYDAKDDMEGYKELKAGIDGLFKQ